MATHRKKDKVQDHAQESVSEKKNPVDLHEVVVFFPFLSFLCGLRVLIRNYLLRQVVWTITTFLPSIHKFRCKALDFYFQMSSLLGSEEVYQIMFPVLLWNMPPESTFAKNIICLVCIGQFLGDYLKNMFCLPRPARHYLLSNGASRSLDNHDFGWPSTHSIHAVTMPFYVVRHFWGSIWVWESDQPLHMSFWFSMAALWTISIVTSRLYLGVHSPADVQGGMMLGALILRVWLSYGDTILSLVFQDDLTTLAIIVLSCLLLLFMTPKPIPATETFHELTCLMGFITGFCIGTWIRPIPSAGLIPNLGLIAIIRTVVGFILFELSRQVIKKIGIVVYCLLTGTDKQDIKGVKSSADLPDGMLVVKFLVYTSMGLIPAFGGPIVFDMLNLW